MTIRAPVWLTSGFALQLPREASALQLLRCSFALRLPRQSFALQLPRQSSALQLLRGACACVVGGVAGRRGERRHWRKPMEVQVLEMREGMEVDWQGH